jgi:predicted RNase H-like HicB family nuclease
MILDLIVTKTNDGYTAEIPSLKGCESWAHLEDEVIEKIFELAVFYLGLDSAKELKIDKARTSKNKSVYKLVFDKNIL